MAQDGYAYDRAALTNWLERSDVSPMSRLAMAHTSAELLNVSGTIRRRIHVATDALVQGSAARMMLLVGAPFVGATFGLGALVALTHQEGTRNLYALSLLAVPAGSSAGLAMGAIVVMTRNAIAARAEENDARNTFEARERLRF